MQKITVFFGSTFGSSVKRVHSTIVSEEPNERGDGQQREDKLNKKVKLNSPVEHSPDPLDEVEIVGVKPWSKKTCDTDKHRCQVLDSPSTTVCREWARASKESHVMKKARKKGTQEVVIAVRRLTYREISRLQSFDPDWFDLVPDLTSIQRIAAIGNAVPPLLAQTIFQGIANGHRHFVRKYSTLLTSPPAIGESWINKTVIDICAGAGGLSLGLSRVLPSFEHLALVDFWQPSIAILQNSLPAKPWEPDVVHQADVTTFHFRQWQGKVGILTGGPPCQPFSRQSKRQLGEDDERDILCEVPRIVAELEPEVFVFENVIGLLDPRNKNYFESICSQLRRPKLEGEASSNLLYGIASDIFNAVDYGVPQNRLRVFIVGLRISQEVQEKMKSQSETPNYDAEASLLLRYARKDKGKVPKKTLRDVIQEENDPDEWRGWQESPFGSLQ